MGAYFHASIPEGTFLEDTAPEFSPDTLALCGMFGMTPVKLRYAGSDRRLQFEACIVNDPADRRIFLTNHARLPERALIGHELVHRMRRERPELYDELVEALAGAGVAHDRWASYYQALREQTLRKEGRALSDAEIREEGVADLVGDLILDPAVWHALQRPSLLQRVHAWIGGVLQSLRGMQAPQDPLGGAGLVQDRARAIQAVRDVLGAWASSLGLATPAQAPHALVLAPTAALRRDDGAGQGWYRSALLDALVAGKGAPARAGWMQWLGWLDGAQRRGECRQAERAWLGLDDFLKERGTVSRQELIEFVREHQVQVRDVVLGADTKEIRARLRSEFKTRGYTICVDDDPGDEDEADYFDPQDREISFEELPEDLQRLVNQAERDLRLAPKYREHQLPGGRSYRELLLTLPSNTPVNPVAFQFSSQQVAENYLVDVSAAGFEELDYCLDADNKTVVRWANTPPFRALQLVTENHGRTIEGQTVDNNEFVSNHFHEHPNILVHVRFDERVDEQGGRVLFLEEIQSDWHQQGRKDGYAQKIMRYNVFDAAGFLLWEQPTGRDEALALAGAGGRIAPIRTAVPDAPFKQTDEWALLAIKRMVTWAAENGFDRIAWTTGEQQAERFRLSKEVDRIIASRCGDDYEIVVYAKNKPDEPLNERVLTANELPGVVGKDLADRIIAEVTRYAETEYRGLSLKAGGEGLYTFYDKILPATVNRWAKRFGAAVTQARIMIVEPDSDLFEVVLVSGKVVHTTTMLQRAQATAEHFGGAIVREIDHTLPVHMLEVTPSMRDAAMAGLPLFRRAQHAEHDLLHEPSARYAAASF